MHKNGSICYEIKYYRMFLLKATPWALIVVIFASVIWPLRAQTESRPLTIGITKINVREKGAIGDGKQDDTTALQSAIDALPISGGTIEIPGGVYLVDAKRSLRLRSHVRLALARDAVLIAKSNDLRRYYILLLENVSDVEICGGQILGERDKHEGVQGEWGYGIAVRGSRWVMIRDVKISKCWGDGICIGSIKSDDSRFAGYSTNIELLRVTCNDNRRQGLTIGASRLVHVIDCEFINTSGTSPMCGIDIEPGSLDNAENLQIENCVIRGNQGSGIQIYKNVSSVMVTGCTIEGNKGYGLLVVGATTGVLAKNRIAGNGLTGLLIRSNANGFTIIGNTFRGNATRRAQNIINNVRHSVNSISSDIQVMTDTAGITVVDNNLTP